MRPFVQGQAPLWYNGVAGKVEGGAHLGGKRSLPGGGGRASAAFGNVHGRDRGADGCGSGLGGELGLDGTG